MNCLKATEMKKQIEKTEKTNIMSEYKSLIDYLNKEINFDKNLTYTKILNLYNINREVIFMLNFILAIIYNHK